MNLREKATRLILGSINDYHDTKEHVESKRKCADEIISICMDEAKMIVKQKLTTFEEKQGAFADQAVVECCRDIAEEAIEKLKEKE